MTFSSHQHGLLLLGIAFGVGCGAEQPQAEADAVFRAEEAGGDPSGVDLTVGPGERGVGGLDSASWCTDLQTVAVNFRLENGKTVSICEEEDVLTYLFGHLGAEPELRYSGRTLVRLGGPGDAFYGGESRTISDLVDLARDDETRAVLGELSDARNTNGFVTLQGFTRRLEGSVFSGCYIFRNGGWQYDVCSVSVGTYVRYWLTWRSADGEVSSYRTAVGESPFRG